MQQEHFKSFLVTGRALALLLLAILVVLPLLFIFWTSINPKEGLDLTAPLRALAHQTLLLVMLNTVWLGLWVIVLTTILALPLAFIMARTTLGRHNWLDVVLLIPFMTPPYIGSMGWTLFMQTNGYLEQLIPASSAVTLYFFSFGGMVLIMSLHLFPFLYLLLKGTLKQISGSLEDAASLHGGGTWYRFRRIIMPLLLSSYGMGALLIFVKTIAEFGTPATFGRKIGYYVMTSEIHAYISRWPIDFGKATSLASALLAACLLMWYVQNVISSRYTYQLISGKGSRIKTFPLRGWYGFLSIAYLILLLAAAIGIPYFSIIVASLLKLRGVGLAWGNFTLTHYADLLTWGSDSMKALMNSFSLSLAASCIAVLLGTWFALIIGRSRSAGQKATDLLSLLPNTVPGIVLVVGLILFWNSSWMPIKLYNTSGMVILTYTVLFLPYTVQYVKASFGQIDRNLIQAGQVFGGSPSYNMWRIILPLIAPGMIAGWMMTFTIASRELVASLLVLPPSMKTSATYIYAQFEQGDVSMGMAMAVITVGVTTVLLLIVNRFSSNGKHSIS